jgi:hypothetical protein
MCANQMMNVRKPPRTADYMKIPQRIAAIYKNFLLARPFNTAMATSHQQPTFLPVNETPIMKIMSLLTIASASIACATPPSAAPTKLPSDFAQSATTAPVETISKAPTVQRHPPRSLSKARAPIARSLRVMSVVGTSLRDKIGQTTDAYQTTAACTVFDNNDPPATDCLFTVSHTHKEGVVESAGGSGMPTAPQHKKYSFVNYTDEKSIRATSEGTDIVMTSGTAIMRIHDGKFALSGVPSPERWTSGADDSSVKLVPAKVSARTEFAIADTSLQFGTEPPLEERSFSAVESNTITVDCRSSKAGLCKLYIEGPIVARRGDAFVVEAVVTGPEAAKLFAKLGGGSDLRGFDFGDGGSVSCGVRDTQPTCIATAETRDLSAR